MVGSMVELLWATYLISFANSVYSHIVSILVRSLLCVSYVRGEFGQISGLLPRARLMEVVGVIFPPL